MRYEKPSFIVLGLATAATHDLEHGDKRSGSAGKHSMVYESCTGHGPHGSEFIGPTSSTGSAYEADE